MDAKLKALRSTHDDDDEEYPYTLEDLPHLPIFYPLATNSTRTNMSLTDRQTLAEYDMPEWQQRITRLESTVEALTQRQRKVRLP